MKNQDLKINISLKNTQPITSTAGNQVFAEGVILRKISRFAAGTEEDAIMPIPVFYDIATGEILLETLPKELRGEFENEQGKPSQD
jgi:hypothetical protein